MRKLKQVTLRHIADRLGLTVHTVSKALRGLPGMSEATRREVFKAARELGYHTKAQEAGLSAERIPYVTGKPYRFVMLMAGDVPLYRMQFDGLNRRLHELGHIVQSLVLPGVVADEQSLMSWLERSGVLYADGLFLTPALPEWVEALLLRLPGAKVMINYPPDSAEVDSVIWDVEHSVHLSVDALHQYGHKHVLYVGDTVLQRGFRLRWQAFLNALSRNGMCAEPEEHLTGNFGSRMEWLELLGTKLRSRRYTAVLSTLPGETEWTLFAAKAEGLSVPADLSIVGFEHGDDESYPELARPILLVQEAGERAAELMLRRIANPLLPYEHVRLLGAFQQGETLGQAAGVQV